MATATTKNRSTKKREPIASEKPTVGVTTINCVFCRGTGRDPYEVLSRLGNCPVCKGHKTAEIQTPFVACLYCKGTGRQRHTRLVCSACKGMGAITLAGPTIKCSQCNGTAREPEADLPCSLCKGAGLLLDKKSDTLNKVNKAASKSSAASMK